MKVNKGGLLLTQETSEIMWNQKHGAGVCGVLGGVSIKRRQKPQQFLQLSLSRVYLNMKNLDDRTYLLSTHYVLDSS